MIRFAAAVILLSALVHAQTIRWHGSFESALKAAQKLQKPIFVVLVERECPDCRTLFATTFRDENVVRLVSAKTVPVILTRENEDYPIELLYTLAYPALFLLSPHEVLLKGPICGIVDAKSLEKELFDE
ncbi:thioredoxin family protein [Hydrogenimonas sp.]